MKTEIDDKLISELELKKIIPKLAWGKPQIKELKLSETNSGGGPNFDSAGLAS